MLVSALIAAALWRDLAADCAMQMLIQARSVENSFRLRSGEPKPHVRVIEVLSGARNAEVVFLVRSAGALSRVRCGLRCCRGQNLEASGRTDAAQNFDFDRSPDSWFQTPYAEP
jgi:hypothetical protein